MIKKRQTFSFRNKVLIEKVVIIPPFRYATIFQNEGCFIHVTGGKSTFLSSDASVSIKNKEAVLLKCGTYFVDWLKNENDNIEVIAFHLYPEILKHLYHKELPSTFEHITQNPNIQTIIPDDTISKFIDSLGFYFENPNLINEDIIELKIKELILLLLQSKNAQSIVELISGLFSPNQNNIKNVVDKNLYENLSIEELARLCNLSMSSFKRKFKSIYDDSPLKYINRKKIERAQELLKVSDFSVGEISFEIGFNDPLYFTRIFKKHSNLSPRAYRNQFPKTD